MSKIPKRRKAKNRKTNGRFNGLDPDEQLTEKQAIEYAQKRGMSLSEARVRQSRMRKPRCYGPRYIKRARNVFYTPRFLEEFFAVANVDTLRPKVIDPAKRMKERG